RRRASLLGALLVGAVAFAVGIPRLDPAPWRPAAPRWAPGRPALGRWGCSRRHPFGTSPGRPGRPGCGRSRRLPARQADRLGSTGAPVVPQALAGAGASARSAAGIRLAGLDAAAEGLVRPRFAAGTAAGPR